MSLNKKIKQTIIDFCERNEKELKKLKKTDENNNISSYINNENYENVLIKEIRREIMSILIDDPKKFKINIKEHQHELSGKTIEQLEELKDKELSIIKNDAGHKDDIIFSIIQYVFFDKDKEMWLRLRDDRYLLTDLMLQCNKCHKMLHLHIDTKEKEMSIRKEKSSC